MMYRCGRLPLSCESILDIWLDWSYSENYSTGSQRNSMPFLKPDPTFYPSPKLAMQAPDEKLAFVAALSPNGKSRPDALLVVDVDPQSPTYGEIVGQVSMPNVGDELHHFGWNACSSALCPYAPHPHVE